MRAADPPPDAALLALVADTLSWPLLLLLRDGTLLHANLAARNLLQRGRWIALNASRQVQLLAPGDHAAFAQALADSGRQQQQHLMRWPGTQGIATAVLSPLRGLRPGPNEGDGGSRPPPQQPLLLALTLPDSRHADLQAFARLHALSPAESRVLACLARGDSSVRAAQALGVAATTVRAQTTSLRRKTGHASVSALLRTVAALPPLASPEPWVDGAPAAILKGD